MFSKLHERLGTAGLVVAVIALVVALGGSAIAALDRGEKKEVKKIAKKYAGKRGPNGPAGPKGDAGANGAPGVNGAPGAPGAKGATGADGAAGAKGATGATGTAGATGATGTAGAAGATGTAGATGATGATGPTCPASGHCYLPSKATETGTWGAIFASVTWVPASFNLPLKAPLDAGHVVIIDGDATAAEKEKCDDGAGTAASPANPEADPGYFCVFVTVFDPSGEVSAIIDPSAGASGAAISGAIIELQSGAPAAGGLGTWAVTAP